MLKVMWFLKRAEGITLEQFDAWWREHLHMIADRQRPQLLRYTVNIRTSDTDTLAGHPHQMPRALGEQHPVPGLDEKVGGARVVGGAHCLVAGEAGQHHHRQVRE